jgi:hypothetical protein
MMTWAGVIKAVLELLSRLFSSIHDRKQEELGRLREAERQAEIENDLVGRINSTDADSVSDHDAFGGPPSRDLPGTLPK